MFIIKSKPFKSWQNANDSAFSLGHESAKTSEKAILFELVSKISKSAVFALGADNGSRTHLSGLGSPHTTDVLYPQKETMSLYFQFI